MIEFLNIINVKEEDDIVIEQEQILVYSSDSCENEDFGENIIS